MSLEQIYDDYKNNNLVLLNWFVFANSRLIYNY